MRSFHRLFSGYCIDLDRGDCVVLATDASSVSADDLALPQHGLINSDPFVVVLSESLGMLLFCVEETVRKYKTNNRNHPISLVFPRSPSWLEV